VAAKKQNYLFANSVENPTATHEQTRKSAARGTETEHAPALYIMLAGQTHSLQHDATENSTHLQVVHSIVYQDV